MVEDYYELLDVPHDASESEIKEAYRERIKESHPDVSDDRSASERTKRLIEAKDVLTDETQRRQYDRVGHDQFVADTPASSDTTANSTGNEQEHRRQRQRSQQTRGSQHRSESRSERTRQSGTDREDSSAGSSWRNSTTTAETSRSRADQTYETWGTNQSYVVDESAGVFDLEHLLNSQEALVLLGTTFIIYPILLAGSLLPVFPTAANLTIGLCTILIVAYLQSIPQVGIVVFGIWSVILPIALFSVAGISLFSLTGVLAMAAVLFPFGLSVLTWIAISPTRQA